MNGAELLIDAFGRIRGVVHRVVEGLPPNSCHSVSMTRPTRSHGWCGISLAYRTTTSQEPESSSRCGLLTGGPSASPCPSTTRPPATGTRPTRSRRSRWNRASYSRVTTTPSLNRRVGLWSRCPTPTSTASSNESWDPPVSLGARLVSVISDNLQHAGQAAFVAASSSVDQTCLRSRWLSTTRRVATRGLMARGARQGTRRCV